MTLFSIYTPLCCSFSAHRYAHPCCFRSVSQSYARLEYLYFNTSTSCRTSTRPSLYDCSLVACSMYYMLLVPHQMRILSAIMAHPAVSRRR